MQTDRANNATFAFNNVVNTIADAVDYVSPAAIVTLPSAVNFLYESVMSNSDTYFQGNLGSLVLTSAALALGTRCIKRVDDNTTVLQYCGKVAASFTLVVWTAGCAVRLLKALP